MPDCYVFMTDLTIPFVTRQQDLPKMSARICALVPRGRVPVLTSSLEKDPLRATTVWRRLPVALGGLLRRAGALAHA